jgi:hypothetical protein
MRLAVFTQNLCLVGMVDIPGWVFETIIKNNSIRFEEYEEPGCVPYYLGAAKCVTIKVMDIRVSAERIAIKNSETHLLLVNNEEDGLMLVRKFGIKQKG